MSRIGNSSWEIEPFSLFGSLNPTLQMHPFGDLRFHRSVANVNKRPDEEPALTEKTRGRVRRVQLVEDFFGKPNLHPA